MQAHRVAAGSWLPRGSVLRAHWSDEVRVAALHCASRPDP